MTKDERDRVSRRALIGLVSSAAVGLAGCFGGGDGDDTPTDTGGSTPGETATAGPTSTPTATPSPPPAAETIQLRDNRSFTPQAIAIDPGETVEWTNVSDLSHTVTAAVDGVPDPDAYFASGGFNSEAAARDDWGGDRQGEIAPGESYRHTFDTRGVYQYFCIPHENDGMVGFIEVGNPTETGTATSEN